MSHLNQALIANAAQNRDWAFFLNYIIKAKPLEGLNALEQARMQLWQAVCRLYEAEENAGLGMLDFLFVACKARRIFCDILPLLLSIAAVHAAQAENFRKRDQLLSAAFLSPYDEELLALVEGRGWQAGYLFIFNKRSLNWV